MGKPCGLIITLLREFTGGLLVRIPGFHCLGPCSSLVGELRSHKLHSMAKKLKKKNNTFKLNNTLKFTEHFHIKALSTVPGIYETLNK